MTLEKYYAVAKPSLIKRVQRLVHFSYEDSEDVVQDAFLRAAKYYNSYNPKKGSLGAWFNTILTRAAFAAKKKSAKYEDKKDLALLLVDDPSDVYERTLENLSFTDRENPTHQEVIIRSVYGGERSVKIAKDLGLNPVTVRQILFRFRKEMRNDVE